jgi:acyl-CoA thioesterase
MSYVRGQVRDESGRLIASFSQDGMIRPLDQAAAGLAERERL